MEAINDNQFEVVIKRPVSKVWCVLVEDINKWWASDFRVCGEDSVVSLDATAGGLLLETNSDGCGLEWFKVQMVLPQRALYLVGHVAPEWGGPTISMLKLTLEGKEECSLLTVSESLLGNTSTSSAQNSLDGWRSLLGVSLKEYAESHA